MHLAIQIYYIFSICFYGATCVVGVNTVNNSDEIIEDSDTDIEITDNDWNSDINTIPKLFDFTGNYGLQCTLSSNNPHDYFSLFFDDSILNN